MLKQILLLNEIGPRWNDPHLLKFYIKGKVKHWYLETYIFFNPLVFIKYIIKLTCESFITIGAQVFEKTGKNYILPLRKNLLGSKRTANNFYFAKTT